MLHVAVAYLFSIATANYTNAYDNISLGHSGENGGRGDGDSLLMKRGYSRLADKRYRRLADKGRRLLSLTDNCDLRGNVLQLEYHANIFKRIQLFNSSVIELQGP